ncbi:hypothetical protein LIN78_00520 [Leeia sp. TBRC 13508]|uniref:Uncharacterized protein n=1 Tax=Leeia speluncae TaxID=2884804 RepID=A0ABS8D1G8_9NEIS|nr:hypothetical protein [Leeia speluncae]MCB6182039.1 hypothetical protein [Leeia speluncae]
MQEFLGKIIIQEQRIAGLQAKGATGCSVVMAGCTPEMYDQLLQEQKSALEATKGELATLYK